MSKRATIAEVAELAGVHKATVSRALNPGTAHYVNAVTAKKVQRAVQTAGYIPNIMARGLRMSLSMTIGVIVPDLENPIFPPIMRGIENTFRPVGTPLCSPTRTAETRWSGRRSTPCCSVGSTDS